MSETKHTQSQSTLTPSLADKERQRLESLNGSNRNGSGNGKHAIHSSAATPRPIRRASASDALDRTAKSADQLTGSKLQNVQHHIERVAESRIQAIGQIAETLAYLHDPDAILAEAYDLAFGEGVATENEVNLPNPFAGFTLSLPASSVRYLPTN